MVYYDIFLTFGLEVERIWLQPEYNRLTLLWALVSERYLLPFSTLRGSYQPERTSCSPRTVISYPWDT
jgi:hypothetical protein